MKLVIFSFKMIIKNSKTMNIFVYFFTFYIYNDCRVKNHKRIKKEAYEWAINMYIYSKKEMLQWENY